ncbi:hypothetical protein NOM01_04375 [Sporolactobacillus sp. STSJ-5]|uniref:hypothetical protein n=1 Tax=Sporolactobacillus sp. STSJ-5 TaxID=2965076 RepID=UPI0021084795|nr:hypothetical protein [Sporolactobacillus sp. STSJ-5]MCQ2009229.1 hypothetical protein [Sporolactobacillus sp. STSJ-5]
MIITRILLALLFFVGIMGDWNQNEDPDVRTGFSAIAFAAGLTFALTLWWPEVAG